MPNVFSSDSAKYAAVGWTYNLPHRLYVHIKWWGSSKFLFLQPTTQVSCEAGSPPLISLSSPRSVPSLLELHPTCFFLLLPRPHTYRRLSLDRVRAAQASHPRMRQARTHARVPSSPSLSLPISGPAAAPACVRRAATATSIKDQQCASSMISPSLSAVYSCRPI